MSSTLEPYSERDGFDEAIKMAVAAMEAVHSVSGPGDIQDLLRKKAFWSLIWFLTEFHGKYLVRYSSKKAMNAPPGDLRHEHVFPINDLYDLYRKNCLLPNVMALSVSCVVTKEEHFALSKSNRGENRPFGWLRYEKAHIEVFDRKGGCYLTSARMEEETEPFFKLLLQARCCADGNVDLKLERQESKKQAG